MWKWIVAAALVIIVLFVATCWHMYNRFTAGGDVATVTIAASPARVYAALADPDSMAVWMAGDNAVTASRHGEVQVGDTVHVASTSAPRVRHDEYTWTVAEVRPNELLALVMRNDSTNQTMVARRDSLVTIGDSTEIISTFVSPMLDSLRAVRGDTGGRVPGALLNASSKMLVSAFRLITQRELERLKAHIEGKPVAPRQGATGT